MRLSLDHLTAVDSTPVDLVEAARKADCDAVCLFMEPMSVLPHMPTFDLYQNHAYRKSLQRTLADRNVSVDLVYPFTLARQTDVASFELVLACAAEIGAKMVNVLVYDREPARRHDTFARFCDLAQQYGLAVALEFYPASQIRSLDEALGLVEAIARPGTVGINVDLLHLMRSGGSVDRLAPGAAKFILYGQLCDGLLTVPVETLDFEASSNRLLPGHGAFDLIGFVKMLPDGCPISVEIPRNIDLENGMARGKRVTRAIDLTRHVFAGSQHAG